MRMTKPLTTAILLAGLCTSLAPQAQATPRTAFVHLFEWGWDDIAQECEEFLGPKGFSAVQISPPNKAISGDQWWTRYQPVSYTFESRSGNREQFKSMVQRCKSAGVDIYLDAVINHMAAWGRNFPAVPYGERDFHNCTSNINYGNRWQVQNCDLSGLNDLATESDYVQQKIADYMNDATSMGVAGFRIDAAKHIPAQDIAAIKSRLVGSPYIFQEVIGGGGEPVRPSEYTYNGNVTEFSYARQIGPAFRDSNIAWLRSLNTNMELSSADAVTFVTNHDEERHNPNGPIWHGVQGNGYFLANIFMLAYPYGYPKIMSGYYFNHDFDAGPPNSGIHNGNACGFDGGDWVCEHKWRGIANMVGFRNHTAAQWRITNWWQNGNDRIAFGRGGLGFVVINKRSNGVLEQALETGMPDGTYCNIIEANFDENSGHCTGAADAKGAVTITVTNGVAHFSVPGDHAAAIHVGAKIVEGNQNDTPPCTGCDSPAIPPVTDSEICFDNANNFANPTLYYWEVDANNHVPNAAWPGVVMTKRGDYFCHDLGTPLTKINVIFSDQGLRQTPDMEATSHRLCFSNGNWVPSDECQLSDDSTTIEPWYFRGTSNGWRPTPLEYDQSKEVYYTIQQFKGEEETARFKIDDGNWGESYPATDYIVEDGASYRIEFNSISKQILVIKN